MPRYNRGDFVKVDFSNETTGLGEWMWVRVRRCDDQKQLVFGTRDSHPPNDNGGKIGPLAQPQVLCPMNRGAFGAASTRLPRAQTKLRSSQASGGS